MFPLQNTIISLCFLTFYTCLFNRKTVYTSLRIKSLYDSLLNPHFFLAIHPFALSKYQLKKTRKYPSILFVEIEFFPRYYEILPSSFLVRNSQCGYPSWTSASELNFINLMLTIKFPHIKTLLTFLQSIYTIGYKSLLTSACCNRSCEPKNY